MTLSTRHKTLMKSAAILALAGGCAAVAYAASNRVSITQQGDTFVIQSNGIADHRTGSFPNRNNPNRPRSPHAITKPPTVEDIKGMEDAAKIIKLLGAKA